MTQENKELLFKDLCSRLPYGVKVKVKHYEDVWKLLAIYTNDTTYITRDIGYPIETYFEDCKPYLFPLSSMTSEQLFEVQEILGKNEIEIGDGFLHIIDSDRNTITYLEILALLEWFYKNHFDIYGLIPKGLAIDATELSIY